MCKTAEGEKDMEDIVILAGIRTPVGRFMGSLREVPAYELGAIALNGLLNKAGLEAREVDHVILGQAYQSGEYVNIARMCLLKAGWPEEILGTTVDMRCCTGLEVVRLAYALIRAGEAEVIVAGGVESMSTAEFYLPGEIRWGIGGKGTMPKGHGDLSIWGIPLYDRIQRARVMSQPFERYGILPTMMSWAETAAKEAGISREECDLWAYESHQKACRAWEEGRFKEEVLAVPVPGKKGSEVLERDETPRPDTTLEALGKLRPVLGGVCTAGNSSSENDGAAMVLVTTGRKAKRLGLTPFVRIKGFGLAGFDPTRTYKAVPIAVEKVTKKTGIGLKDIGLIEIQEAFAAQVLADLKEMGIGPEQYGKINVNGSGISLGHPIAATGTRVLVTLIHEMRRSRVRYGLEAICGGGGLGMAGIFELWEA